jgi:hypothetical protein
VLNETDPVLSMIDDPARRRTLVANRRDESETPAYRFDIVLEGANENVFFEIRNSDLWEEGTRIESLRCASKNHGGSRVGADTGPEARSSRERDYESPV